MIRPATPDDIQDILPIAFRALSHADAPFPINKDKIAAITQMLVCDNNHFSWLAENDGKITGIIGVMVHEMTWHTGKQASLMVNYCESVGDGIKLMRMAMDWIERNRYISMIVWNIDNTADPRYERLLKSMGLKVSGSNLTKIRS